MRVIKFNPGCDLHSLTCPPIKSLSLLAIIVDQRFVNTIYPLRFFQLTLLANKLSLGDSRSAQGIFFGIQPLSKTFRA